jgi:hypothetical protein
MRSRRVFLVAAGMAMLWLGGCFLPGTGSSLFLLHASDDAAYFEYYEQWSGFDVLPSTVWKVDLTTGQTTRVADAGVRYDTKANDAYYAFEEPIDNNERSRIVATRISTGHEIVVAERDVQLGGKYDRVFALLDDHVVALTGNSVLVYDLSAEQVERTIAVVGTPVELLAANEEWALIERNNLLLRTHVLINLTTEESILIPETGTVDADLSYFDAAIVDDYLFTSNVANTDNPTTPYTVQAFHIPTQTWSTLTNFGTSNSNAIPPVSVLVKGANATHVLAEYSHDGVASAEWIDRATGDSQQLISVANPFGGATVRPQLRGDNVCWLSEGASAETALVTYAPATGSTTTTPVNVPN